MSTEEKSFLDDVMGFDPSNLDAFQDGKEKGDYGANIYRTNPVKMSKSDDHHYHSRVKILYNPFCIKRSIIKQCQYVLKDEDGYMFVKSALAEGDKNCPIFKSWKKLWFSGDETKKEWAKKMFEKSETQWVLVQIIEDGNQPDLVGQFKVMKLPTVVYEKLQAKMHPTDEKKAPVALMDYLIGPVLEMDVQPGPDDPKQPNRKFREISYTLCDFESDPTPIIAVDGTPLFDEDEIELIEAYAKAKADQAKARTEEKKAKADKAVADIIEDVKKLYVKALDYIKANAIDVDKECGYQPWDDAMTNRINRWLDKVINMIDPATGDAGTVAQPEGKAEEPAEKAEEPEDEKEADDAGDGLPF